MTTVGSSNIVPEGGAYQMVAKQGRRVVAVAIPYIRTRIQLAWISTRHAEIVSLNEKRYELGGSYTLPNSNSSEDASRDLDHTAFHVMSCQ